jgi:hypothetical protein
MSFPNDTNEKTIFAVNLLEFNYIEMNSKALKEDICSIK